MELNKIYFKNLNFEGTQKQGGKSGVQNSDDNSQISKLEKVNDSYGRATVIISAKDVKKLENFKQKLRQDKTLFLLDELKDKILMATDATNVDLANRLLFEEEYEDDNFPAYLVPELLYMAKNDDPKIQYRLKWLLENYKSEEIYPRHIYPLASGMLDKNRYFRVKDELGFAELRSFSTHDINAADRYLFLHNKNSLDDLSRDEKKLFLKKLVEADSVDTFYFSNGEKLFPLLPQEANDYCKILPLLAQNIGMEAEKFTDNENKLLFSALDELSVEPEELTDAKYIELTETVLKLFPELKNPCSIDSSIKLLQEIKKNENFDNLNESDKKILELSCLFFNVAKVETANYTVNSSENALEAFYLAERLDLSFEDRCKLHDVLKNSSWLDYIGDSSAPGLTDAKQVYAAFDMMSGNLFEMVKILTEANLKASGADKASLKSYTRNVHDVEDDIRGFKITQPFLPVTQFPKGSEILSNVGEIYPDGSTDIKGVYLVDGITVLKFNEIEDFEKIGFPKGSNSRGIKTIVDKNGKGDSLKSEVVNTGNIKFFCHGLDKAFDLVKFYSFKLPNSDALLSASYAHRPEDKYKFFRKQGLIFSVDNGNVFGGGGFDSGSGFKKTVSEFKHGLIDNRSFKLLSQRLYVPNLIKKALSLSDKEYLDFIEKNANKPFGEIEPKEAGEKIIKAFSSISSVRGIDSRDYNEFYVSNPKPMALFAYDDECPKDCSVQDFVRTKEQFLLEHAKRNDFPFVVFGN